MTQQLPDNITPDMHPYLMRLVLAYQPHTQPPSRQQMLEQRYQLDGHLTMKLLAEDVGITLEGRDE